MNNALEPLKTESLFIYLNVWVLIKIKESKYCAIYFLISLLD